jgi:hypothetical protein
MEDNRRQSERINIPMEIVLESSSGKRECRLSDLGTGGCFVDSIATVSDGEVLTLMLRLPDGRWLKVGGKVTYLYPGVGFGLRFIGLSKEEQFQLEQVILAHGGKPSAQQNPAVEKENEPVRQDDSLINTKSSSSEFEQFMQDLFDTPDESKIVQMQKAPIPICETKPPSHQPNR